jgi:hypothetical protein
MDEEKKITITGTNNRYQITKLKKEEKTVCKRKGVLPLNANMHQLDIIKSDETTKELNKKLAGYKQQDIKKGRYSNELFIGLEEVEVLLLECGLKCHYCLGDILVRYENVREPMQWSLDRIDNELGHNRGNLIVCCLTCNLKRRRTGKDAFLFTKQLVITRDKY